MEVILRLLLLFFNIYLISPSNDELILNNPNLSNKTYNPANYKIIILSNSTITNYQTIQSISSIQETEETGDILKGATKFSQYPELVDIVANKSNKSQSIQSSFMILKHYDKLYHNSYALSSNLFTFIDHLNNTKYLVMENKLYVIKEENFGNYSFEFIQNLNFSYIDYIKGNQYSQHNEYIIYGIKNNILCFFYIDSHKLIYSDIENIENTNVSCKSSINSTFICIYSKINQVKLSILNKTNDQHMANVHTFELNNIKFFSDINEPIIYDTDKIGSKIICGRKNSDIKCSLANFSFHHRNEQAIFLGGRLLNNVNILFNYYEIIFYNISEINSTFSFNENNCNYARFISEYLICCGNLGVIICERREMNLRQVYFFNITLNGNIKNLIIENHNDSYLELLYYNETLESNNIYEYLIYPPKCKDINLELFNNGSSVINLDNLFERKTNTNYYISFDTSFSEDLIININTNNNSINNLREKIKLELSDIKLYYDFKNIMQNKITINYNISIEETYSDSCTISIIFKNCYNSCKECSLSEEDSHPNSHNCIKCKENYYQFPNSSNCFTEEEIKINNFSYYF